MLQFIIYSHVSHSICHLAFGSDTHTKTRIDLVAMRMSRVGADVGWLEVL
jgi:hypothetical protein